jgi:hypothetical protein
LTPLLLLTVLNLAPGIQLADNVAGRHVALSEARIRLVSSEEDEGRPSLDSMTREQLAAEMRRLDETRPSLVGPIVLTAVGVGLLTGGYVLLNVFYGGLTGLSVTGNSTAVLLTYLGFLAVGLVTIAGVVLAIIGSVKLITRIVAKIRHGREVSEVQSRIDEVDRSPPSLAPPPPIPEPLPLAPVPDVPPPPPLPPPPPPPQANLVIPPAMQLVMTF